MLLLASFPGILCCHVSDGKCVYSGMHITQDFWGRITSQKCVWRDIAGYIQSCGMLAWALVESRICFWNLVTIHWNQMIDKFQEYKGKNYIPLTTHSAIWWGKSDPFLEWQDDDQQHWQLISGNTPGPKKNLSTGNRTNTSSWKCIQGKWLWNYDSKPACQSSQCS